MDRNPDVARRHGDLVIDGRVDDEIPRLHVAVTEEIHAAGYHVNEKAPNFGAFFMRGSYSGSYAFTFTLFNTVEKSEILQKSRLKNMQ